MQKAKLRNIYKKKRQELSFDEIEQLQKNIYQQVFEYDFSAIENIHIFLPIEKQKELNTYPIIDFLEKKGKQIIISKSDFSNNTLQHFVFDKNTKLLTNKYGIPEPFEAKEIDVEEIDLVFVPLLISDKQNFRVGYGKGFYDRFLAGCSSSIKTIGVNFFKPILKIEDCNEFDFSLDKIIYPKD